MAIDVRIDPKVSDVVVADVEITVSEIDLGGIPRGAAVVMAGPDGLGPVEAVDIMNSLAQHGYESVLAHVDPATSAVPDDAALEIVEHLVERLGERGWEPEQIAVIGYGEGARAALVAGSRHELGAAISVPRDSMSLIRPAAITSMRTPWLGMVGLGSESRPPAQLEAYRQELSASSREHTSLVGYTGAPHCLKDETDPQVHAAAFDSWQRTAEWLNTRVVPRPTPLAVAWQHRSGGPRA